MNETHESLAGIGNPCWPPDRVGRPPALAGTGPRPPTAAGAGRLASRARADPGRASRRYSRRPFSPVGRPAPGSW